MAKVGDVFGKQKIFSVAPQASVSEAAQVMSENRVGCVVVLEKKKLVGIFTERDVLNKVVTSGLDPKKVPVSQVMSGMVCVINAQENVAGCYERMQATRCRHLPIVEDGQVVGMVTMRDLLEKMMKEVHAENKNLKDYLYSR